MPFEGERNISISDVLYSVVLHRAQLVFRVIYLLLVSYLISGILA